jgi:membrane-anchored mycosin MYCP
MQSWGQQYLRIDEVHKLMLANTGSIGGGVKVAVIDTGVSEHQYLQGRLDAGGDYVDPADQGVKDCDGHGTEVAGIIAAKTPSDTGFRGVAPDARIVSIRQSSQNYKPTTSTSSSNSGTPGQAAQGSTPQQTGNNRQQEQDGTAGTVETLARAVRHAADIDGVKVINMSVDNCRPATGTISPGEVRLEAAIHYAVEKNVVVVAAAGNTGTNCMQNDQLDPRKPRTIVTPPWFAQDVLSVAAIDRTGGVANFSVHGPWVSVAAPGTEIISLDPTAGSNQLANQTIEGNQEQPIQGTSFAAPYVSGLVALVRAKYPNLDARAVMRRVMSTAQHPGADAGRDDFVGAGIINPMAALTAVIPQEENIPAASARQLPGQLPPSIEQNRSPLVVAFAGTGGGLVALLLTLFIVHTIRRAKARTSGPAR